MTEDMRYAACSRPESDAPLVIPGAKLRGVAYVMSDRPVCCQWCDEPINEHVYVLHPLCPYGLHPECALRMVVGSVGHLTCRCSCYGGDMDDPPGMSRREAALAAKRIWESGRARQN